MLKHFSKKFAVFALIFSVIFVSSFLFSSSVFAAIQSGGKIFGGKIETIIPCLFPFGGFYIKLSGLKGGEFLYQIGASRSYLFGPPNRIGQWLLGYASGGASCYTARKHGKWRNSKSGGLIIYHGAGF